MKKTWIMLKEEPVLEIENYACRILDYKRLPVSLRYEEVTFDDVMHGWTENRTMNIGKTNAKKLLNGFGISQSNPYLIARLFHFASLSDSYWLKEEGEEIGWNQVNLFTNPLEKAVSATALLGVYGNFRSIRQKIYTPELTAQGMAAKAWIREPEGLYLYKVGKKELAAARILEALAIPHVDYREADREKLLAIASQDAIDKISDNDEKIVKCKIISSENRAIVPWEDFQTYCSFHNENEYEYIKKKAPVSYYRMQIADYILGNEDRHGANWGFFMENQSGALEGLYPLMDHDHAFCTEKEIPSQTSEEEEMLYQAARHAAERTKVSFEDLLKMDRPEEITGEEWQAVQERTKNLMK